MAGIKILHSADFHIGARENFLGDKAELRRNEALLTFEKCVELAKENEVELFLIAGDLLDFNKVEKSFVDRIFTAIESAPDIKFVFSAGNHDPLNSDSPFLSESLPENLIVLKPYDCAEEIKKGVKVYGKSFSEVLCEGEDEFSVKPQKNDINIMCIHGEYGFSNGRNPITKEFVLKSDMDYIALGHVHARSDIKKEGNTYIAYSGCPEGLGFDETGEKGVLIGTVDKNLCDFKFVSVCKRMHIVEKCDVTGLADSVGIAEKILADIKEKYGEDYAQNLYKIELTGEVDGKTEINTSEINARLCEVLYFAKVKDKTEIKVDLDALKNEITLKGIFTKTVLNKIKENPENANELKYALKIGLKAFENEVKFDEN